MLCVWHSHPATPARMSAEDLRLAYTPDVAYLITSLAVDDAESLRGYDVNDGEPHEIEIVIEASTLFSHQAENLSALSPMTSSSASPWTASKCTPSLQPRHLPVDSG